MTPMVDTDPWLVAALAFSLVVTMLGVLYAYQLIARPEPEMLRKLFHLVY